MKNEFFDPETFPYEVTGFFEELINQETGKVYGIRFMKMPTRKMGSPGALVYDITEPTPLKKGFKEIVLKASPKRPVRVLGMIHAICGRNKEKK